MEKRMIIKENLRLVTYALIASFILGFIINTVIILVLMGEFTFCTISMIFQVQLLRQEDSLLQQLSAH